jgi:hypothetical protein
MFNKCFLGGHPSFKANPYLVGGLPTPLKNMSSSVGMIIPNILKNTVKHVPNHQPDMVLMLQYSAHTALHLGI